MLLRLARGLAPLAARVRRVTALTVESAQPSAPTLATESGLILALE